MGLEKKIQKSRTCERLVPDSEIFGGKDLMPVLGIWSFEPSQWVRHVMPHLITVCITHFQHMSGCLSNEFLAKWLKSGKESG